jgi:mannosyltransferase OCH1-like enzyme
MKKNKIILIISIFLIILIVYNNIKKGSLLIDQAREKEIFLKKIFPTKNINFPIDNTIDLPNVTREYFVPKIIYRTHVIPEKIKPYQKVLDHTKEIVPNYKTKIFFDKDIEKYIKNNYSQRIFNAYKSISPDYGPACADLFRYLLIYKEGGIYLDIKSAPIKNLDNIIDNLEGKMAISNWSNFPIKYLINNFKYNAPFFKNPRGEYQNWHIISGKGNPLLGQIIKQAVTNIEYGIKNREKYSFGKRSVLCMTGPIMMTKVIENYKNKNDFKYFKANLNNHLKYDFINHKKIENNNHYTKKKNKYVLKETFNYSFNKNYYILIIIIVAIIILKKFNNKKS